MFEEIRISDLTPAFIVNSGDLFVIEQADGTRSLSYSLLRNSLSQEISSGKVIELNNNGIFLQWRYIGDLVWRNLLNLSDLKGPPGDSISWKGAWVDTTSYKLLEAVSYGGASYICVNATGNAGKDPSLLSSRSYWGILSEKGAAGASIVWRGAYLGSANYIKLDAVSYEGQSYICKSETSITQTLPTETSKWDLLAAKGSAGSGGSGTNNLVFTTNGGLRILTGYKNNNSDTVVPVREAGIVNNLLQLTLASFDPELSASTVTLNWDDVASSFSVEAVNPTDTPEQFITVITDITAVTGSITTDISNYAATGNDGASGVNLNRTYTVIPGTSFIRPVSTTSNGGKVEADISFNYSNGGTISPWADKARLALTWGNVAHSITINPLTGKTFLESYSQTTYSPSVTAIGNTANRSFSLTANNQGTGFNSSGAGTLNFQTPIHKSNASSTTTNVTLTTTANRPLGVTGSQYSVQLGPTTSSNVNESAQFSYPSFWLFTSELLVLPTEANIINGTGFGSAVTTLPGSEVKTLSEQIVNSANVPKAFWFAVRASASQPTVFKVGNTALDAAATTVTNGGTVLLGPSPLPSGYSKESYRLWGFTLQPGTTYVIIS